MSSFFLMLLIGVAMVVGTNLLFYELLRNVWNFLPRMTWHPRLRILLVIVAILSGHVFAVTAYAILLWRLIPLVIFGNLSDAIPPLEAIADNFDTVLYFSAATYSSLGVGDIVPTGDLRILSGFEVLNGLMLIGWSVSFTYLAMEKFWDAHFKLGKKKR